MQTFLHLTTAQLNQIIKCLGKSNTKSNRTLGDKISKLTQEARLRDEEFGLTGEDNPEDQDDDYGPDYLDEPEGEYVEEVQEEDDAFDGMVGMPRD